MVRGKFTVFFEGSFWVGVAESFDDEHGATMAKVVFGAEPSNAQLLAWAVTEFRRLETSRVCLDTAVTSVRRNPKRVQREARRALEVTGIATASQEAMRLLIEAKKADGQTARSALRHVRDQVRFRQRQAKRKEKHRGH